MGTTKVYQQAWWRLCVVALLSLLVGCATSPMTMRAGEPYAGADMAREMAAAPAPVPAVAAGLRAEHKPAAPDTGAASSARKVHYHGQIGLRAPRPREVIEQAVAWVQAEGGYVQSRTDMRAELQIPAARFRAVFDRILGLGEVLRKSISARDVTEEYLDIELRLKHAQQARDRLLALIRKTTDTKERLQLLREVERISAEIEAHELRMARLRTLVDYSRLTLQVQGRPDAEGQAQELRGFSWVQQLAAGPLRVGDGRDGYTLAVPEGMVPTDEGRNWSAASADGVTLATLQRRNDPEGATAFWREALRWRLRQRYAETELPAAGDFVVLRLVAQDAPGEVYWVAVVVRGDKLRVGQAYFPSVEHEQRYGARIRASLSGGGR